MRTEIYGFGEDEIEWDISDGEENNAIMDEVISQVASEYGDYGDRKAVACRYMAVELLKQPEPDYDAILDALKDADRGLFDDLVDLYEEISEFDLDTAIREAYEDDAYEAYKESKKSPYELYGAER